MPTEVDLSEALEYAMDPNTTGSYDERCLRRLAKEVYELRDSLNFERMRLAAVGVAVHGGSVDECKTEYQSDALEAVCELQAELARLTSVESHVKELPFLWRAKQPEIPESCDDVVRSILRAQRHVYETLAAELERVLGGAWPDLSHTQLATEYRAALVKLERLGANDD